MAARRSAPRRRAGLHPEREIIVRFDGNVQGLTWDFRPDAAAGTREARRDGDGQLHRREAGPTGPRAGRRCSTSSRTQRGIYFNKIECFCFTEQTLAAGRAGRDAGAVLRLARHGRRPRISAIRGRSRCPTRSSRLPPDGTTGRAGARATTDGKSAVRASRRGGGTTGNGKNWTPWLTRTQASRLPSRRSEPVADHRRGLGLRAGAER